MKGIVVVLILLLNLNSIAQDKDNSIYKFGHYTIKTGMCESGPSIRIIENDSTLYYACGGDGMGFSHFDTLSVNSDTLPDFLYCYQMEDYTTIGIFVSNSQFPYYKSVDLIDLASPEVYGNIALKKNDEIVEYLLSDLNKDGNKDLLTNLLKTRNNSISIKNFTDTIYYKEIKERAEGKILKPRSQMIFLDQ